jgi:predicted secreted hydrolase
VARRAVLAGLATVAVAALAALALLRGPAGPSADAAGAAGPDWASAVADMEIDGLGRPTGPWTLALPQDHGPHPEARSELWQLSAHLADAGGTPFGVQLSLLRVGLAPPGDEREGWNPREVYRGHVVVTDGARGQATATERFGRGMTGVAGFDPATRELRLDHWSLTFGSGDDTEAWTLIAGAGETRVELALAIDKPPVAADAQEAPFRGYTVSRLQVEGSLETGGRRHALTGVAWFDHLWGELPIPGGSPVASDRLQLQLDDGREVSVIRSRRLDGGGTPTIDAFLIGPDGTAQAVDENTARVDLGRHWDGAGAAWPVDWSLGLGDLELAVTPVLDKQAHAFALPLWSGLVRAEGRQGDRAVTGMGTLQLTGYGAP